jgi:hypothetical protein
VAEIAGTVKAIAHAMKQRGTPNAYQRLSSELYRSHIISRYKRMPRNS